MFKFKQIQYSSQQFKHRKTNDLLRMVERATDLLQQNQVQGSTPFYLNNLDIVRVRVTLWIISRTAIVTD